MTPLEPTAREAQADHGSSRGPDRTGEPARLDSRDLFRSRNVVLIRHADQDYVLRLTRHGKLILTK